MLHSGSCRAVASSLILSGVGVVSSIDDGDIGAQDGGNSGDESFGKVHEHTSGECATTSCWKMVGEQKVHDNQQSVSLVLVRNVTLGCNEVNCTALQLEENDRNCNPP